MFLPYRRTIQAVLVAFLVVSALATVAYASHSWGGYHWARTANPFNLKLGDNVSSAWDAYLGAASSDWSVSLVLDTTVVSGQTDPRKCRAVNGKVQVCNSKYGFNGWLGVASIWVNGSHITQGTVKLNDTYFNTAFYNTPAWRQFVTCQEVGHTFGLDHQDEIFGNPNLGTCMDYTSDPDGTLSGQLSNLHPNAHDYEELDNIIYAHLDGFTSVLSSVFGKKPSALVAVGDDIDTSNSAEWGKEVHHSKDGRSSLHERDLGKGQKVFTFVLWAK